MTDESMEIFLLAGQSNMAGRGALGAVPPLSHPDIQMFRNGRWVPAQEPLHTDKPAIAGVGLGMSFALDLLTSRPGRTVGLLPCAVGGTPLCRWMPGADLYVNAVALAKAACASGTLKGILWHQGENDAHSREDAGSYGRRLSEMIVAMRAELGASTVPFIAGELGAFLKDSGPSCMFFDMINAQLRDMIHVVPRYGCASASGLTDMGDKLHFDSASLREFGRRYAGEYRCVIGEEKPA